MAKVVYNPDRGPESRWTRPSSLCPHPEWWTSDDGLSTELEVTNLVAAFVTALQPECVVETGSAYGQTAQAIGEALRDNGHGHLISLELNEGAAEFSRERCAGLPVEIITGSSVEWTPTEQIDLAWFDSEFNLRIPEFLRYKPWMHSGTVVGFHDTAPHWPLLAHLNTLKDQLNLLTLHTPRGVSFGTLK